MHKVDFSSNNLDDEKAETLSTSVNNIDELIVAGCQLTTNGIKSICYEVKRRPNSVRYNIF